MNYLKLQQDALKLLNKGQDVRAAVDSVNGVVWLASEDGGAIYRIPQKQFYLDTEKLHRVDGVLKSLLDQPINHAKPTKRKRISDSGKKQLIEFETERCAPVFFDEKLLKPFKDIYKEVYRISDNGYAMHVLDENGETKAVILCVRVKA